MKGILFSEVLFPLVVDGTKTQTRRIIKQQPKDCSEIHKKYIGASWKNEKMDLKPDINPLEPDKWDGSFCCSICWNNTLKPHYKVGEKVYLKEPYFIVDNDGAYLYKYGKEDWLTKEESIFVKNSITQHKGWKNKLFMSESAARYFIDIIGVRVERLQDISQDDCLKEGIFKFDYLYMNGLKNKTGEFKGENRTFFDAKSAYADLIDSINGKGTWESNPFMWVYDFKLTDK